MWFHVRGAPGAHVILRQQPGDTASDEDMTYAADLAAFHSKLRTGGKVDVSYTSPKFVRKPSGRGLHSSTSRLNVSVFCWIGGAFRGC